MLINRYHFRVSMNAMCLAILCLAQGCGGSDGPKIAPVTGILTQGGKPVAAATVTFYPIDGRPSFGTTNDKGEFVLSYTADKSGAVVGPHTVKFSIGGSMAPPPPAGTAPSSPTRQKQGGFTPPQEVDWPEQIAVDDSTNEFTFDLE